MAIYFVTTETRPCAYVRCELPARYIRGYGVRTVCSPGIVIDKNSGLPPNHEPYPIYVFQIPHGGTKQIDLVSSLRLAGKTIIVEFDDNYFDMPSDNMQVIKDVVNLEAVKSRVEVSRLAHMITVSTPGLVDVYKEFCENVVVLPNCIDFEDFPKRKPRGDRIVIGWAGAQNCGNLEPIVSVLEGIIARYDNVDIYIGGDVSAFNSLKVPEKRKKYLPAVPIEEFPRMINKFDIAVIPLLDNIFNKGKSCLKGLQYGALKIPFISSNVAPYREFAKLAETHEFIAKAEDEWFFKIERLIRDNLFRKKIENAVKRAAEKRQMKNHVERWINAYYEATNISGYNNSNIRK